MGFESQTNNFIARTYSLKNINGDLKRMELLSS